MSRKTRYNAGETLVEVMASIVIFLLVAAILEGAVSYSSAAMRKSRQMRKENEEIFASLRTADEEASTEATLSFIATNKDGSSKGNQVFSVTSRQIEKKAKYQDEEGNNEETSFYLYEPTTGTKTETEPSGGDS